ncbi:hypothetical protein ZWY2020_047672 [Hordeum vulgare]|nr:hypothetical protein ZWY2020_047672 [Hordeum vulgare]
MEGFVVDAEGLINNGRSPIVSPQNLMKLSLLKHYTCVLYCLEVTKNYDDDSTIGTVHQLSTSVQMVLRDHPIDAELLNSPLEYYNYMELCFANKHAIGIYSMETCVPLGTTIVVEDKDKPNVRERQGTTDECSNMTDAMREIASAINNTCRAETHPDLYKDLIVFDQNERLTVLDYLTEHKAKSHNFMKVDEEDRQASFKHILKGNHDLL